MAGRLPPGRFQGRDVTVQDVYEAVGAQCGREDDRRGTEGNGRPRLSRRRRMRRAVHRQHHGHGHGIHRPFSHGLNSVPALHPKKEDAAYHCGQMVMDLLKRGVSPLDILTRQAFENAIVSVAATGGSTNAVLHLLAMAREANVPLAIDDFDAISARTPIIADLKPAGRYLAVDVYRAGGIPMIAKKLLEAGFIDGSQMTPTGKTIAEEAARVTKLPGRT